MEGTLGIDRSTMCLNDLSGDGQTQTGSVFFEGYKGSEYFLKLIRRNPAAIVPYDNVNLFLITGG